VRESSGPVVLFPEVRRRFLLSSSPACLEHRMRLTKTLAQATTSNNRALLKFAELAQPMGTTKGKAVSVKVFVLAFKCVQSSLSLFSVILTVLSLSGTPPRPAFLPPLPTPSLLPPFSGSPSPTSTPSPPFSPLTLLPSAVSIPPNRRASSSRQEGTRRRRIGMP
jgi:hypothetical protein